LWLAAIAAVTGIVIGGAALTIIRQSDGRLRGTYRAVTGMMLSLLSRAVVLFTMFSSALVASMV
jgi:hypothetical protein